MAGPSRPSTVTELLQRWSDGDREAAERAVPLVYDELRRIAARQLRGERGRHTQATAIVHETYLRLHEQANLHWPSRDHFYAFAAHLIRRILVDHARRRNRSKRGGDLQPVTLQEIEEHHDLGLAEATDLMALDEALARLETLDPRKAAVVELRFFAGLSLEETAVQLGVSLDTVGREWRRARAWLYDALRSGAAEGAEA
ncbi:MAG TPA: sigma-70 family RNA polymerase sigma factor [Thermoanaerobaculia bacterium]|nr:sigma-70 family RNA polymerase sigma factor [Thermoanaerobaculia bacterium]